MRFEKDDERIHDQRDREESAEQHREEPCVSQQRVEAALADGVRHEAHDAEGREADDPLHDLRHTFRDVGDERLGCRRGLAESDAEQDRPRQDADVIRLDDGVYRIVHHGQQQVFQHFDDAAGRRQVCVGDGELQLRREQERRGHRNQRGAECADHVKPDDRAHRRVLGGSVPRHGVADEDEDENRRDAFKSADKQLAENGQ